jgi:hypothetical protein
VSQAYDVLYRSGGSTKLSVTDYCQGWDGDQILCAFAPGKGESFLYRQTEVEPAALMRGFGIVLPDALGLA